MLSRPLNTGEKSTRSRKSINSPPLSKKSWNHLNHFTQAQLVPHVHSSGCHQSLIQQELRPEHSNRLPHLSPHDYPANHIDERTFVHVLSESMIKESPSLEGNNQAKMVNFSEIIHLEKNKGSGTVNFRNFWPCSK